ncbi:MAG: hydroxyethylthiazole kinase [Hafnia sp.]|uniref:hydroxyethylthiazole kinase n=1 Tax=Hafnia sp. TaxID=1873498 RepID=UPI002FC8EAC9
MSIASNPHLTEFPHIELPGESAAAAFAQLRHHAPLVHCLTNEVVQTFTANVLLALGASPAMVVEPQEAAQFSSLADALLINIGTLHAQRAQSMLAAIESANHHQKPWVLDPVAVGGLAYRTEFARQLLALKPSVIRGNASEILALSGMDAGGRGVDSTDDSAAALPAAQALALQMGAVVAVTGATDYVTDGQRVYGVTCGDALMTRVVGTGCALSAVVAAFSVRQTDLLLAVATACQAMSLAGERAVAVSHGPGSFVPAFIDALYHLTPQDFIRSGDRS